MFENKETYREFCQHEPHMPIFLKDWWLDAVCIEGPWDAAIFQEGGQIKGVMPYYRIKGRLGHIYLTMPHLTQFLGPWLCFPAQQKYTARLSFEKNTLAALIAQLPPFDFFGQNFHFSVTNFLPFYWQGFQQSSGYTYILDDLTQPDALLAGFRSNIRGEIRKAEKQLTITVDNDIEKFYHMVCKTYERQKLTFPLSLSFLKGIDEACATHQCRRISFALDQRQQIHGALYMVWDQQSAYHLISGADPQLRTSGATSLLMWEAMGFASTVTRTFDFEGSMIQPIERFFSSFGAVQKPYLSLSKVNSRYIRWKRFITGR